uniref:Choline transporter-like protein 1 n=1 Tax=Toxocara canis TaxID=6265 RepID=A0A183U4P4_TOXCA
LHNFEIINATNVIKNCIDFRYHNYYFWIPIIAPFFGAVFAAWSYYLFVGFHIVDRHPSPIYMKDIKDDSGDSHHCSEKLSYWDDLSAHQ